MNELNQLLIERQIPPSAKTPPRQQRMDTANKMIEGYQNGWQPNPVLTRLMKG